MDQRKADVKPMGIGPFHQNATVSSVQTILHAKCMSFEIAFFYIQCQIIGDKTLIAVPDLIFGHLFRDNLWNSSNAP